MPFVYFKTNVTKTKASAGEVNAAISKALSRGIDRPEKLIMTHAELGADIQFAESDEVRSTGRVGETYNAKVATELTAVATNMLGIPGNRVFVVFSDVRNFDWAINGELLTWVKNDGTTPSTV